MKIVKILPFFVAYLMTLDNKLENKRLQFLKTYFYFEKTRRMQRTCLDLFFFVLKNVEKTENTGVCLFYLIQTFS